MGNALIAITGANGFVGRCVVDHALDAGHKVRALVRRAGDVPFPPGAEVRAVGDMGPDTDWADALDGVDVVIHAAGRAHVLNERSTDPLAEFRRVNVQGSLRLVEAARRSGVGRLVFVSSIGVNGSVTAGAPFRATDLPEPDTAYGRSKLEAELALREASQRQSGPDICIIRPPLVYGPHPKGNLHRLMRLLSRGLPLPFDGIANRRTMIGVDNLSDALLFCATAETARNGLFLVGDGEISTTQLLRTLSAGLGRPPRLFRVPSIAARLALKAAGLGRMYDQLFRDLVVDSSPLRDLGFQPRMSMDEGLRRMARSFGQINQN